jgi:hypothetical protein
MSLLILNTKKITRLSTQTKKIIFASKTGAEKAIKESKKLGLEITFLEDGKVYKESPNGKRVILTKMTDTKHASIKLTKGMVLNATF